LESDKNTVPPADAPTNSTAAVEASAEEVPGSPPPARAGQPSVKTESPSAAPPAARVAPGAAKASTTPTASVAKGVPKAVAAKTSTTVVESTPDPPINKMRRRIVWATIAGFTATLFLAMARFFLPRTLTEPSSIFRIGFPSDYSLGVDTKFQQQHRIWVVKNTERLFVIFARCTHLGCTPDWKASENKFKCPCHGSGYDSEGINFEGPAPRPMDRAAVELDAEGQILVNTGKLFDWQKGGTDHFNDPGSYLPV
jgi:cytochrome b6-f complex iron-sulfur subunit